MELYQPSPPCQDVSSPVFPPDGLVTIAAGAKLCHLSESQLRARITSGALRAYVIQGRRPKVWLDPEDIEALIAEGLERATAVLGGAADQDRT